MIALRQISIKPVEGLHELWRLSPAVDINPSPSLHRVFETEIIQGGSCDVSLDVALETCEFFDRPLPDTKRQADQIAKLIKRGMVQSIS